MSVPAIYFDGRTARAYPVTIDLAAGRMTVTGTVVARDETIDAVEITDEIGLTPRLVRFSDGAFCEVTDVAALGVLLDRQGIARSAVSRWERHRGWIAAAIVLFLVTLVVAYRYGVPALAHSVAMNLPAPAVDLIGTHTLAILDRTVFTTSEVPGPRQAEIVAAFGQLRLPDGRAPQYPILFRRSEALGANALALPSGVIIVTDGLVELAKDDREILGVLSHEVGHIDQRHGLRQLLQNSIVTLFVAGYLGDVGGLVASAPTVLLQAKYSRDFEREADGYAADVLNANGIALGHLADILERFGSQKPTDGSPRLTGPDYLSTHPATAERLDFLRRQ